MSKILTNGDTILSHNNPCFQCNIAITNFLVFNMCEIRFNDVIGQSTVPISESKESTRPLVFTRAKLARTSDFSNTVVRQDEC